VSSAPAYGRLDRALHRVAFATRRAQLGTADLEERMFRRELRSTAIGPPVLVTALPRAGTTMLLELLAACPDFAAHTYRDMPFVLCPMLWRAFSRRFRRSAQPRERAHGDGIRISSDSPEAFEEVLWSVFWAEHYGSRSIAPWTTCARPEFAEFFASHRRKIVALRARDEPRARRYVSKNNLNIARIPAIWEAVPDATVVVPFRDPVQQAASLLRQHLRFLALHRDDPFARRYMAAIGHFEFGANLRPIDFGGWVGTRDLEAAQHLPFWLDYWLATYRHLLAHASDERLAFVDFTRLAATGDVAALGARLGIADIGALRHHASRLQPPPVREVDLSAVTPTVRAALRDTFAVLAGRAVQ
jgi:Sulfotransferase family